MKDYKFIPYNQNLVSRARELRKEVTEAENIFWNEILKNKKLANLKFTRQKPLGAFIVDFYCASLQLAIEIDGGIHAFQKQRDKERESILEQKFAITFIRYSNEEILNDVEKVRVDVTSKVMLLSSQNPPDKGD